MFTNGENLIVKPHRVIFRSPLLKLHYYHNKWLQARNPKYLTNLQLNPYPNTQLDLFYSDSSPFWCTAPKYVTNGWADPSTRLQNTNLKILLVAKILQFIHMMKTRKMLGHKTMQIHSNFFKRKRWTRSRTLSSVTICLNKVCSMCVQFVYNVTALKTILLYV